MKTKVREGFMNFKQKICVILGCLILTFQVNYAAMYNQEDMQNINLYEKINPSIVAVEAEVDEGTSSGTGCIVAPSGVILTSSHVIDKSRSIEVILSNGQSYRARVLSVLGNSSDLALLKINPKNPLPVINIGDSGMVKVGQRVLTIGNPFGFNGTLTTGIVSRIDYQRGKIQTDAAINPGCSGGPLLNTEGEVIGINQSIYNPDNNKSNIGIGFAVPINQAKDFLAQIKNIH